MRTISNLAVPKNTDTTNFPDGGIQNQTDVVDGTPVIEEIYGDLLTNVYKLLRLTDVTPNQQQDNEANGHQVIQALKLLTNDLNDVEKSLVLNGTQWSVPMKLSILPNKYFFIAIAGSDYDGLVTYTFKGSETNPTYQFTSPSGFTSGDQLLVIIDQSGVKALNLTSLGASESSNVPTAFGSPIAFNSGNKMSYLSNGKFITDDPSVHDIQTVIRAASLDPLAVIYDTFVLKNHVLCFVYLPGTVTYQFWQLSINDLTTATQVAVNGITIPVGTDNAPYAYVGDDEFLYVTNRVGSVLNDRDISRLNYTPATPELTLVQNTSLENSFTKTSNVFIKNGAVFTFINTELLKYNIAAGTIENMGDFETTNGQVFSFNGNIYYTNGEIGVKWTQI